MAQRSLSSVAVAGPSKLGRRTAEGSLPGRVTAENAGIRSFSSYNMPGPAKGLPTYSIWAEESMLSLKLIPPAFRANRSGLYVDPKRQGKIIFEFTPRKSDEMRFDWDSKTVIALSPEEVGLVCSQLPHSEVSFVRKAVTPEGGDFGEPVAANLPDRVMTITPVDGGAVRFHIDFVKDGLGGQGPGIGQRGNVRITLLRSAPFIFVSTPNRRLSCVVVLFFVLGSCECCSLSTHTFWGTQFLSFHLPFGFFHRIE